MRVTGIIAEYNPFHNGHQYHLKKARELTGADYIIIIMSGDYVQRGAPAIYNKYLRTKAALLSGADLVLEMPVFGSAASAGDFASCGISMLNKTGITDSVCFGSECGSVEALKKQAEFYETENEEISRLIKDGLRSGLAWPLARERAFLTYYGQKEDETASLSSCPNDILGCEYLKAIKSLHSSMTPVTVIRKDPGYHSEEKSGSFASATAARKAILSGDMDFLSAVLPDVFFSCLEKEACPPVVFDDFSLLLNEKLFSKEPEEIFQTADMPKDLAAKLGRNKMEFHRASDLVMASKDRQYTYARVSRCLLNLLLGITKQEADCFKSYASAPWLRILGFRKEAGPLLTALKKNTDAPLITKTANAGSLLPEDAAALFSKHLEASERYRMVCELKSGRTFKNEFTRGIIITGERD